MSTVAVFALSFGAAAAQQSATEQVYGSRTLCVAERRLNVEQCENAETNSRAEFDEKAPRFHSRTECERYFRVAGCSVGFRGSAGWAGRKTGIYFAPRQIGFRVRVVSPREMTVRPYTLGPEIGFAPRSILKRDAGIDPRIAHGTRDLKLQAGAASAYGGAASSGRALRAAPVGALAPGMSTTQNFMTQNFDCAALLEDAAKEHAETACFPAPARRR
ncbi:MAG TPA: DUF1190 domain-containing protein [Methylocystis sp.]|nr:DUF1190 domain-containing protein [Methylocystis sp.]